MNDRNADTNKVGDAFFKVVVGLIKEVFVL